MPRLEEQCLPDKQFLFFQCLWAFGRCANSLWSTDLCYAIGVKCPGWKNNVYRINNFYFFNAFGHLEDAQILYGLLICATQ